MGCNNRIVFLDIVRCIGTNSSDTADTTAF
jgi:hypothetical protein